MREKCGIFFVKDDNMLEKLMNNPYILLISFVLGVFGTAFAIYEHYYNKERKEITYRRFTNSLIIKKKVNLKSLILNMMVTPLMILRLAGYCFGIAATGRLCLTTWFPLKNYPLR